MQQFESLADSSRIHQALELGHYRSQQDLRDRELENVIDAAKTRSVRDRRKPSHRAPCGRC
jgi:hypothetical protein